MGKVISIQIGRPKSVNWKGDLVTTSIFKSPIQGPVNVSFLKIMGDEQADLKVHGGRAKAVYAYPTEHYRFWNQQLDQDLPWGSFGENLSIEGYSETDVRVGDQFQIGSVKLQVTQPRFPCYKLGVKFADPLMVKKFTQAMRNGFYLRVLEEGVFQAGDQMTLLQRSDAGIAISDFIKLYLRKKESPGLIKAAMNSPGIPEDWIDYFSKHFSVT